MAVTLSDFEFLNNGNASFATTTTSPLDGSQSGQYSYNNNLSTGVYIATTTGNGSGDLGATRAQLTMHCEPRSLPTNAVNKSFGFVAMQSQRDISGGTGSFYYGGLFVNSGTGNQARINKGASGLNALNANVLRSTAYTVTQGQDLYVRFVWAYESSIAAVLLQLWLGASLGTLALTLEHIDDISPLTTSVGESIIVGVASGTGGGNWVVDNWDYEPV